MKKNLIFLMIYIEFRIPLIHLIEITKVESLEACSHDHAAWQWAWSNCMV